MTNIVVYIPNNYFDTIEKELMAIPCFITRELIEMDYSEVGIQCRTEDASFVEILIAPFI